MPCYLNNAVFDKMKSMTDDVQILSMTTCTSEFDDERTAVLLSWCLVKQRIREDYWNEKKHTKLMAGLIVLIVCLALLAQIAMAAEPIYVPMLAVSISLTGESPPDEEYEIILKADDPAYPMPEGSVDGEYKLLITGKGTDIFPEIQFSSLGIYTYTVFQTPGTNELADYDDAVYNITIYIINAPANGGFEYMVTAHKAGETEKLSELVFENEYAAEEPVPTPTLRQHRLER